MNERLRVLQVEDSASDAAMNARLLEKAGYDIYYHQVEDADEMRDALDRESWDIILADHHMGQFDAPGALRILRESGRDIPFIIVSGNIGEELAVALMKAGAHDYVNKYHMARLAPAVGREVREARSRRERREAEERLSMAVEATQLGMFDLTPQTGKLIWSEMTRHQFGLPADAAVSYEIFLSHLHADDRERTDAVVRQALVPGSDGQYANEFRTLGAEGRPSRWISSWGRAFFDAQGRAVRLVGVTLDITERKRLEDEFRQAQKLESVGRLAGGIAHDFNNLLTIINGYSELMLERLDASDPFRKFAAEIRKAGGQAADLTRQLLAFSRKQMIEPKPMNVNQLVSANRNMLARLIGEDVELVTRLAPDLDDVLADNGQLHQVLMNLVVNARDAMPKGGRLTIETANRRDDGTHPGDHVLLMVTDTGIGMDKETRKRIFEPFFTTKREGVGTGLGMATVHGIVKMCGGWIDFTSEPGVGTKFTIGLPKTAASISADESLGAATALGGGETVLVVEDQVEVRALAVMVLKSRGYHVLEARHGAEALNVTDRHAGEIHLLLSDVVMPGMDGKELADRLRTLRPGMRILFMSGYSNHLIANQALTERDMGYISKPFSPEGLARKVRSLLGEPTAISQTCGAH